MTDQIFDAVANSLQKAADKTGLTYKQINVFGMFFWMGVTVALTLKSLRH